MTNTHRSHSYMVERVPPRRPMLHDVTVVGPTVMRCHGRATDISEEGCRISVPIHINTGSYLDVAFSPSINAQGWVAWSKNGVIGMHFTVPMSSMAVAKLSDIKI